MLQADKRFMYGVEEMDSEHAQLIEKAEGLMQAYQDGNTEEEMTQMLMFLAEYTSMHFKNEEALMASYNYPDLETHKTIHESFKSEVSDLIEDIKENGLTAQSRIQMTHLTTNWIHEHIGGMDKDVALYILAKRA